MKIGRGNFGLRHQPSQIFYIFWDPEGYFFSGIFQDFPLRSYFRPHIIICGFLCHQHARRLDFFSVFANRSKCVKVVNLAEAYHALFGFCDLIFFFQRLKGLPTSVLLVFPLIIFA